MARTCTLLIANLMAVGMPAICYAAQPDGASVSLDGEGDIVVTAQRREQGAQKVGASLSVLTGDQVAESRIQQPGDISSLVVGLSTTNATADGTTIFAIRGVGLEDFNPNNSSGTAVYIDDVYQTSPTFLSGQLFDVGRVEVLKGPQGTLYGKNATGGAISIISEQPKDRFGGYFDIGYGRWGTLEADGAVAGPLAEGLTYRIAAVTTQQDHGYQRDVDTGRRYGRTRRYAGRATLKWDPSSAFSASLTVRGSRDYSTPSSWQAYGNEPFLPPEAAGLIDVPSTKASVVRVGDLALERDEKTYGATLRLEADLDFANVISTTAYDYINRYNVDNTDGTSAPAFELFQRDRVKQIYQEVRAASKASLFGTTDWIVGANYSGQRFRGLDRSDQSTSFVGLFETPPDLTSRGLSVAQADYRQRQNSYGLFANTTTHLTDRFRLVLGLRYSHDSIRFDGASTEIGSADGGVLFQGVGAVVTAKNESRSSDNVSYKAGLEYSLNNNVLFYGGVSSGYKAGVFYASPALDQVTWRYARPETLTAYEVGVKSSFFDRKLILNASVFQYDYSDRQSIIIFVSPASGFPVGSLANLPKARVRGAEVEWQARPVAGLRLSGGVSYLDSSVRETLQDVDGAPVFSPIAIGSPLAQAPKWSVNLGAQYEASLGNDYKLGFQVDYRYVSRQLSSVSDPNGLYGSIHQLNGNISLSIRDRWKVTVWGQNLTNSNDTTYSSSGFLGGPVVTRLRPVSYGVRLGLGF